MSKKKKRLIQDDDRKSEKCFDLILYAAKIPNSFIVEFVYFFSIQDGQPIIQKMEVGFHNDEEDDVDDPDDENTYETLSVHKGSVDTDVRKIAVGGKYAAVVKTPTTREGGVVHGHVGGHRVVHVHLKKVLLCFWIRQVEGGHCAI